MFLGGGKIIPVSMYYFQQWCMLYSFIGVQWWNIPSQPVNVVCWRYERSLNWPDDFLPPFSRYGWQTAQRIWCRSQDVMSHSQCCLKPVETRTSKWISSSCTCKYANLHLKRTERLSGMSFYSLQYSVQLKQQGLVFPIVYIDTAARWHDAY